MSYLLAGAYFILPLIYIFAAGSRLPLLLIFAPISITAGLGILGTGGKLARLVAYLAGVMVIAFFIYWAVLLFLVSGKGSIPLQIIILLFAAISFGVLTIYSLRENGQNI